MATKGYDFKKEWPKIKAELNRVSQEAMVLAKKGEKEIRSLSKKGKLHFDAATLKLKQEHLYRQVGKEYIKGNCPAEPNSSLKKLIGEFQKVDKELQRLNRKIKAVSAKGSKKSAR